MTIPVSVTHWVWFLLLSSFIGQVCASAHFGFPVFLVIPFDKVVDQIAMRKQIFSPPTYPHKKFICMVYVLCVFSQLSYRQWIGDVLQAGWRIGQRDNSGTQGYRFPKYYDSGS